MQVRGASRKILVVVLGLMTIGLGGAAIYVGLNLQNQQAPEDTSAYGFGEDAVKENFGPVLNAIEQTPCSFYVNERKLGEFELYFELESSTPGSVYGSSQDYFKICKYSLANRGADIYLSLQGYPEDAEIDDNREALYTRVNNELFQNTGNLEQGRFFGTVDYFLGRAKSYVDGEPGNCLVAMYHVQNDFEYASVEFKGFNCEEEKDTIKSFSAVIADRINRLMLPFRIEDIQFESQSSS